MNSEPVCLNHVLLSRQTAFSTSQRKTHRLSIHSRNKDYQGESVNTNMCVCVCVLVLCDMIVSLILCPFSELLKLGVCYSGVC